MVFTEQYNRRALRFIKRHPDLKSQYLKTLNYWHLILNTPLKPLQSVFINLSYRITLELLLSDEQIILVNVGDHNAVY